VQNYARHADLVDPRNVSFQVPQGAELTIDDCSRMCKEWEKEKERRIAAEAQQQQLLQKRAAKPGVTPSSKAVVNTGSDDEDDPDAERGIEKKTRKDTTLHHIDLEQGYRPRHGTEVVDLRTKL
jgi:hypothetical protein